MPRVLVHLKNEQRINDAGETITVPIVRDMDPWATGDAVSPKDGFDLAVLGNSDFISIGFYYNDGTTPPSFELDPFSPLPVDPVATSLEELKAQVEAQDAIIAQMAEQNGRLRASIDAIVGA